MRRAGARPWRNWDGERGCFPRTPPRPEPRYREAVTALRTTVAFAGLVVMSACSSGSQLAPATEGVLATHTDPIEARDAAIATALELEFLDSASGVCLSRPPPIDGTILAVSGQGVE